MSIQANMNQAISLAGMMARLNPNLGAKAENRAKIKELKRLQTVQNEQYQAMKAGLSVPGRTSHETAEDIEAFGEEATETARELFRIDPSMETYMGYKHTQGMTSEIANINKTYRESVSKAEKQLAEEQERSRNTRRALGISDLETPEYPVRAETEPSGYQRSLSLKTSEREPMHPELQKKKGAK